MASVLTGWYLMMPPYAPADKRPLPALSQWAVRHAFDSAAACEKELAKELAVLAADEKKSTWSMRDALGEGSWGGMWGDPKIKLQQCIATDDPRLAPRGP
jgi:hypothetical protein